MSTTTQTKRTITVVDLFSATPVIQLDIKHKRKKLDVCYTIMPSHNSRDRYLMAGPDIIGKLRTDTVEVFIVNPDSKDDPRVQLWLMFWTNTNTKSYVATEVTRKTCEPQKPWGTVSDDSTTVIKYKLAGQAVYETRQFSSINQMLEVMSNNSAIYRRTKGRQLTRSDFEFLFIC